MFLNPLIPAKEIEKERGVILQEESMYRDMPVRYVWDVFEDLLYGDQPAGWNIVGTKETIQSISRKELVDYFKKYYSLSSTILVLAGNFNEKKALEEIEKIFKLKKNTGSKNTKNKVIEKQTIPQLKIHFKETDQTHLLMGFRSCDMFATDRFASVLAGTILGSGMSSRLFDLLREKYGLTYYVDAASEQMTDTGYFFARAGVEHANLEKVIGLILEEMKKLKTKKVTKKELENAKESLKGKTMMALESSSAVASFLGDQELFRGKIKQPEELFVEIDKVTADDIIKASRKYLINKNLNLAVVGPHKNESELKKFLKI
jgi:predicted Zn-dependent peptidase